MTNTFSIQVDGCTYNVNHSQFLSGNEKVEVVDVNDVTVAYANIDHDMEWVDVIYANEFGHPDVRGEYNFSNLCSVMECKHHELVDIAKWLVATHPVNG